MHFRRTLIPVGLSILLMSLAVPAQKNKKRITVRPIKPPVVAPLNTEELKGLLAKEKVKPLLVNFWATWCDPCRDEFPDLVKIDSEYRPKSLDFVTVSLDDASEIKLAVPKFLANMKATMPAYWLTANDPEPAINAIDPNWSGNLPATFLYNEKGEIVFKHFGRVDASQLRAAIEKAVKK
jgi:thiol-disulfide isomerase/thioredoxin